MQATTTCIGITCFTLSNFVLPVAIVLTVATNSFDLMIGQGIDLTDFFDSTENFFQTEQVSIWNSLLLSLIYNLYIDH